MPEANRFLPWARVASWGNYQQLVEAMSYVTSAGDGDGDGDGEHPLMMVMVMAMMLMLMLPPMLMLMTLSFHCDHEHVLDRQSMPNRQSMSYFGNRSPFRRTSSWHLWRRPRARLGSPPPAPKSSEFMCSTTRSIRARNWATVSCACKAAYVRDHCLVKIKVAQARH